MLGALPDEAVKKNLPGAGFLGRESLRGECEPQATHEPAAKREAQQKKRTTPSGGPFSGALPGTRTLGPLIKSQLLYQLS